MDPHGAIVLVICLSVITLILIAAYKAGGGID